MEDTSESRADIRDIKGFGALTKDVQDLRKDVQVIRKEIQELRRGISRPAGPMWKFHKANTSINFVKTIAKLQGHEIPHTETAILENAHRILENWPASVPKKYKHEFKKLGEKIEEQKGLILESEAEFANMLLRRKEERERQGEPTHEYSYYQVLFHLLYDRPIEDAAGDVVDTSGDERFMPDEEE